MRAFAYDRPSSEVAAIRAASMLAQLPLVQGRAPVEYLAGGTTLVDLMKLDVMRPAKVVDLGAIAGAHDAISVSSDGVRLGAMVKMSAAADHPEIVKTYPVISQSLQQAASATTSQHGDARRQCASADAVPVFSRYVLDRLQQARSRFGLRRDGRFKPTACDPWRQSRLHRDLSRRLCPKSDCARCDGYRHRLFRRQNHSVRRPASIAGRNAKRGDCSRAGRSHHRLQCASRALDAALALSQDP